MEFGIFMIIFGITIILAGSLLLKGQKSDFNAILLWKSNIKNI